MGEYPPLWSVVRPANRQAGFGCEAVFLYRLRVKASAKTPTIKPATESKMLRSSTFVIHISGKRNSRASAPLRFQRSACLFRPLGAAGSGSPASVRRCGGTTRRPTCLHAVIIPYRPTQRKDGRASPDAPPLDGCAFLCYAGRAGGQSPPI